MLRGSRKIKYLTAIVLTGIAVMACLLCFTMVNEPSDNGVVPNGLTVVDEDQWSEILTDNTETALDRSAVIFNGTRIAYNEAVNTYYIPQDMSSESWSGTLTAETSGRLWILDDPYLYDKATAIGDGHSFSCIYQSGSEYSLFYLIFTGLPIVSIEYNSNEEIVEKEEHAGRIYVQETDGTAQTSSCMFHVRGHSASQYEKRSWKISLTTSAGDKNHLSLCGMREDDDWILNAMFVDPTRIREPLASWTWDIMQIMTGYESSSPDMQYVEFFLNDEYYGLFLLMEPLDGKALGLTDGDLLYQKFWAEVTAEDDLTLFNGEKETLYAEIRWPKSDDGSTGFTWNVLQNIMDYGNGLLTWNDLLSRGSVPDIMNLTMYNVYTELMYAYDNLEHNMMFECTIQEDGTYSIRQLPWDLNFVMGCGWYGEMEVNSSSYILGPNFLWETFESEYPEQAQECIRAVWQALRDAGLTADLLCSKGEGLWQEITESGAFAREKECWEWVDYTGLREEDVPLVFNWIQERFDYLDNVYGYSPK